MKRNNYIQIICSILVIALMAFISEITNQKEIICPQIAAPTIGLLILPDQPWKADRKSILILMTIFAIIGLSINLYLTIPVYFKIGLSLIFIALALTISDTTITPIVATCIIPIVLNMQSWIYPISVTLLCTLLILIQLILEKNNIRKKSVYMHSESNYKLSFRIWLKRLVVIMIATIIPCATKNFYFIAPPLIVAFIGMTDQNKNLFIYGTS